MNANFSEGMEYTIWFDVTKEMVIQFAELTGDKNPIHLDEEYASKTRFKRCIVPGMLIGGLISKIVGMDFPGNGSIYLSQDLKFIKPVYIGDKICITCVIKLIDRNRNNILIENTVFSDDKTVLIEGVSKVKLINI